MRPRSSSSTLGRFPTVRPRVKSQPGDLMTIARYLNQIAAEVQAGGGSEKRSSKGLGAVGSPFIRSDALAYSSLDLAYVNRKQVVCGAAGLPDPPDPPRRTEITSGVRPTRSGVLRRSF